MRAKVVKGRYVMWEVPCSSLGCNYQKLRNKTPSQSKGFLLLHAYAVLSLLGYYASM